MPFTPDPEVHAVLTAMMAAAPRAAPPAVGDHLTRRQNMAALFGAMSPPLPSDVSAREIDVRGSDGTAVYTKLYEHAETPRGSVGILYLHGGGYIGGSIEFYGGTIGRLVKEGGARVVAPDYRLAPEWRYPTNVDDAWRALVWLYEHAEEIGVDKGKIVIMGDSGGGGLAAALAHYNLEKNGPPIAKQILVYPMIDDRNVEEKPHIKDIAVWSTNDNITGWQALLGDECGKEGIKPSAAPSRMTDATGLPPTYIDTGELDLFAEEDIEYALKLTRAGIECELHVYPGCVHAFEVFASQAKVSKSAWAHRLAAIANVRSTTAADVTLPADKPVEALPSL